MYITAHDHLRRVFFAALVVIIMLAGFLATQVRAAEVQVETVGELIAAITAANASGEPTVIVLSEGGDYVLASVNNSLDGPNGLPVISGDISIQGNGATIRRSDADSTPDFRFFRVMEAGRLNLEQITVSNGYMEAVASGNYGGAIYSSGALEVTGSVISGNTAQAGGGLMNRGTAIFRNNFVNENHAINGNGGGIVNSGGRLELIGSGVIGNETVGNGGGISNGSTLTVVDSTISHNDGEYLFGGGVYNTTSATATFMNSTISNNSIGHRGGGISNFGKLDVTNSTISDNHVRSFAGLGSGIHNSGASYTLTFTNSLIAGNKIGSDYRLDVDGNVTSDGGYNLVGDGSGTNLTDGQNGNQIGDGDEPIDPLLEQLHDNGGPTHTMALLAGSPAIDAIPEGVNGCGTTLATDQRRVERPQGDGCDIGAFELVPNDPAPLPKLTITASSHTMAYGDPVPSITPSYEGFVNNDTPDSLIAQPICSTTVPSSSEVGSRETSCSGAESLEYEIHYVSGELVVDPRPITVTADSHFKLPGEVDPDLSYQVSEGNLIGNDELAGEIEREPGEEPGTYRITQGSLAAGSNYDLTFVEGTLTIGYGVCLDFDNTKVKKTGSVVPIRLILCDPGGNNVSSDSISLAANSLVRISSGTSGEMDPDSAGSANPDGDFRFAGDRYIYNLSTRGMTQGTWQLSFTVNGSESPNYRVDFQLAR